MFKKWTWAAAVAGAVFVGVSVVHAQEAAARRPDVVVFLADDMTVTDAQPYGGAEVPAPNMMALVKDGMTFDRAYAISPTCAPSRAGLLTGRYGVRSGAMYNHQLPAKELKKWPARFRELGYEVAAIGKVAHYDHVLQYGFDHAAFYNYHEDQCVDEAVKWLAARPKSGKPLCLIVGTNWPHVPWPAETPFDPAAVALSRKWVDTPRTRQQRAKYDAAVANADRDLGKVRDAARQHLPADTLFVFTADQGSQWPFAKWNLYEAGIRVPLIVSWPGRVAAGARTDAMVSWIDVMPTLLEAADPKAAAPADIDGRSFLNVLAGKADAFRDRVFASHSGDGDMNYYPSRSVRVGDLKYIRNLDATLEFTSHVDRAQADSGYFASWVRKAKTDAAAAAIVKKYHWRPAEELYDLKADPEELKNLAAEPAHAADLATMRAALDEWMQSTGDKGIASDEAVMPPKQRRAAAAAASKPADE